LPHATWVDLEAATSSLDEAEGETRRGEAGAAWAAASVAASILKRGFCRAKTSPGSWRCATRCVETWCVRWRCCGCVAGLGEPASALRFASDAAQLEPYRESAYERMIRAQRRGWESRRGVAVYEELRRRLTDDLGADPSSSIEAVYLEVLRG